MAYSREQRKVIRAFDRVADRMNASPRERKALYAAGLVESALRSLDYGDRDSLGPLQQRPSMGWGSPDQVKNPEYAAKKFLSKAQGLSRKRFRGSAGKLAQAVQRSAFPERYDQRGAEAEKIIRQFGGDDVSPSAPRETSPDATTPVAALVDPVDLSRPQQQVTTPALSSMLDPRGVLNKSGQGGPDPSVLFAPPPPPVPPQAPIEALTAQANDPNDLAPDPRVKAPVRDPKALSEIDKIERRMDIIDKRKLPYLWGGGHVGDKNTLRRYKGALDCSGAVSKVLGIDPRVSGQFGSWGKSGKRSKGDGINVYYNDEHVLMSRVRNGREEFWGTSKSNPGGGAGWIPRSAASGSYLSRFKVRHI